MPLDSLSSGILQKLGILVQVNIPERQLILSEQATMVEELAASLNQGDVVEGIVTRVVDYGAFVSLRSPDGGMHGAVVRHPAAPCMRHPAILFSRELMRAARTGPWCAILLHVYIYHTNILLQQRAHEGGMHGAAVRHTAAHE